jgi:hypothetical protein
MDFIEVIINDLKKKASGKKFINNLIDLGATRQQPKQWGYQVGSVGSKYYAQGQFTDEEILNDLLEMKNIYENLIQIIGYDFEAYVNKVLKENGLIINSVLPSNSERNTKNFSLTEKNGYLTTDFDFEIHEWEEMLSDSDLFSSDDIKLFYKWSRFPNSEISAKQFGELENRDLAFYRNKVVAIGARIAKKKRLIIFDDKRSEIFWAVTMDGRYQDYQKGSIFIWKLKKNLQNAIAKIKDINILEDNIKTPSSLSGSNTIIYGVPGSGKSYLLDKTILTGEKFVFRTTFFPDYTNTDFIGQILPKSEKNEKNETIIKYDFKPGPFTIALKASLMNPNEKISLVIEELNRGNAPAIFGDLFQLLDRNDNGESEYSITNQTLSDFLNEFGINISKIYLPKNLYIYATMNTSDQNVFTLDNAFKRRWDMLHVPTEANSNHTYIDYYLPKSSITWGKFLRIINEEILSSTQNELTTEDKQIGAYFIKRTDLSETENNLDEIIARRFANKMLSYLWLDIAKFDQRAKWFQSDIKSFDDLLERFLSGEKIFTDEITEKLNPNVE